MSQRVTSLDTVVRSSVVLASSVFASGSRPDASGTARAERSGTPHQIVMHVLASFSAFHVHSTGTFGRITGTRHLRSELLCAQHRCLSNPRCSSPTGNNTDLHHPLIASLRFVTNLSLRFLSVDCVFGGVVISDLGNSGTFTCTVLSASSCTGSPSQCSSPRACRASQEALRTLALRFSSQRSNVSHLDRIASTVFTDDHGKHCARCSSLGGEVS